jgi:carboxyl-terminal processing protease
MKKIYLALIFCSLLGSAVRLCAQSLRDTVSREDKLYALSMIWKEADYNFVFFYKQPHLNWDSVYRAYIPKILATRNVYEYFRMLSSFTAELKDGHTMVYTPPHYWDQIDSPPVRYVKHDGKRFVTAVDESLKDQIPIGSEITGLNGKTWDDYYNNPDFENNNWFGFRDSLLQLTLLSPAHRESKVVVKRNNNLLFRAKTLKWLPTPLASSDEDFEFKSISAAVAYVTLNTFGDSTVVGDFEKAIPEIRKHRVLILDIRRNSGGNDNYALRIAKYLTDKPYIVGSMWKARTNNSADKAWAAAGDTTLTAYLHHNTWDKHPGDTIPIAATFPRLNMQVYVLTSKSTFSAAEDFLIYLNGSKNIIRIGQTTGGSSGEPLEFHLPHGLTARVCAKADAFPDGMDFINVGIKPDIEVEPFFSLTGEVKDAELDKALAVIDDAGKGK